MATDDPTFPFLLDPAGLAARLGDPGVRVLDASWYRSNESRDARAEHAAAHVPGAAFLDLDAASDPSSGLPHTLPSDAAFASLCAALGLEEDGAVVVYDATGHNLGAARAWWQLRAFGHPRVALLDGGLGRWRREGFPVDAGAAGQAPARRPFLPRLDRSLVRTRDDVLRNLADPAFQLVDLRSAGRFAGTEPEPRPGLRGGHVPGARSLPWDSLVDTGGVMLSPAALESRIRAAGLDPARPIVAMCGSGTSACALMLAFRRLAWPEPALYDGSWADWGRPGGTPVALGTDHSGTQNS